MPRPHSRLPEPPTMAGASLWAAGSLEEEDSDAVPAFPARVAPPLQPSARIGDLGDLLNAVKARLVQTVAEPLEATPRPNVRDTLDRVKADVLDCVGALGQLHTMLGLELIRCQQLELKAFDARTALAQARAELAGTQAGERNARHQALHDSLTSLPNRGYFRERLDGMLATDAEAPTDAESKRKVLAVLFLDLDDFKPINDLHGHAAGDQLLSIVAARLNRAIRSNDMVSRLGGDEFACLLSDLPSREQLGRLACKLFDAVSAPVRIGPLHLTVRPSIGIAMCPSDGVTAETLLKNADTAMYCAKRQQSGYAFFDQCAQP